jgi:DNA-binding MarR family transcriptional regulator
MTTRLTDSDATHALAGELRDVLAKLNRRLRAHARPEDVTPSQIAVIKLLMNGPATVTALARAEGVRQQSMGATVASLEAAGMVAGAPDPNDGRQTVLSLTPACRRMINTARAKREDWLFHAIETHLKASEQKQLALAVELLKRIADS